uniref:VLIG-type G domain-containing protein n=1 Tax=Sphenodon punctatus TaxID=8508 RepID=A0A8D0GZN1_SPHPU
MDRDPVKRELARRLSELGLNSPYWLPKLGERLGVTSVQALKHLRDEDYLKLECEVQHPWEKRALQKLLNLPVSNKATMQQQQEQRLEMLKKRQDQAKSALAKLNEMQAKGKSRHEEAVKRREEALRQAMDVPPEYWVPSQEPLREMVGKMHKQLALVEESVSESENLPDMEVLGWASGGLALQGIYKTSEFTDLLGKREQLVSIPEGFRLLGPEQGPLSEKKEFSSTEAESTFRKSMEQLGFSISVAAKGGFWGFKAEASTDYSKTKESEETHKSRREHTYICTTMYNYVPLASCYFPKDQLRLSSAALQELQNIEQLLNHTLETDTMSLLDSRCGSFFNRFGSHANQGPLHFGGIFWWKASSEGFRSAQLEEVRRQTSEALSSYVGVSFNGFGVSAAVDVSVSKSGSEASLQGTDRKNTQTEIQLFVSKTGGPPGTDSFTSWKSGLLASNKTWSVIDRGSQLIPVWDIILSSHRKDFQDVQHVSSSLKEAYSALTNQNVSPLFGEELVSAIEESRSFLDDLKSWKVTGDEEQLVNLTKFKQKLNEKTKNNITWINVCLSNKALQEFLANTVSVYKDTPAQNTIYIKSLLRCLLDPHVYSVQNFPQSSSIMQWIFHQEEKHQKKLHISEFADFTEVLKQMKDNIQEVTYEPESSAAAVEEAKIKATLNVSCALDSLVKALRERAQTDIELLLLSTAARAGYQRESSTFQHLLGCPEINFLLKEMTTAHDEYLTLRDHHVRRAQAFLLLTALTVTSEYKHVSLEEKKKYLNLMKWHLGKLLSTEMSDILRKHSACNDWDELEKDLKSLVNGDYEATRDDLQTRHIIKELEDISVENQAFANLIKSLGLENYYPRKMGTADFHVIHKSSLQESQPSTESQLPFYFLQKLLMQDYRVRYLVCKDNSKTKQGIPNMPTQTDQENDSSDILDDFFSDVSEGNSDCASSQHHVHPMDIQMAIFHCADDFMRQYISTKLAFCQFALPLLMPDPCSSQIEFPLWSLSQVKKSWKGTENSGEKTTIKNKLIYQADIPLVSFIRLGSSSSSKSQILNALLSKHKHDIFFHRHCRSSSKNCLLMDGVVEISWYCPGGRDDDRFDNCIAFTNLHGDATDHEKQVKFLQELTSLHVVLCSASGMNETSKQVLQGLLKSPKPLVCLLADKENIVASKSNLNIKLGLKNRNEAELIDELAGAIKGLLTGSCPTCSLEGSVAIAQQHGFIIDEDKVECKEAKNMAQTLMVPLKENDLSEIKTKLLPLQGELWHQWCKKDKELTRLQEKRSRSIEQHRSQIESEKHAIRHEQLRKAFPLNVLMRSVLEILRSHSEATKKYFLQWLKVFMDDLSSDYLAGLHQKYHKLWSEMLKKKKDETDLRNTLQNNLEALSSQINTSTIGLEHVLREVGQIYKALDAFPQKDKCFFELPRIAAHLMVSGIPIELMDGDASYVPLKWIGEVFDKLIEKLGDKKVFVLSVLGIQSTGKSTLLNAMFGLQFSVSSGRCTRGAFMQLIKVDENLQQDLNIDFLLVVDTEGLRAIEMANKFSLNHDNELATFVIGIGNMTLINIFGENPSEMQDILQIAVQAFLRMKQVHLSPSCFFVHQNVGEITAKEKNMEGRRRLQEKLDEMTLTAAQQEFCDITCFSDVIRFDVNTHIHYFAHLWEGDPPMAPPNPSYSQNVQELKQEILLAAKKEPRGRILSMSELKVRISDLWNALLNENFIFSFKNTLEIAAYSRLETIFSQWTWQLRSHILDLQTELNNQIRNRKEECRVTRESLENQVKEKYDTIMKDLQKYFSEEKESEILIQWKTNIEIKLNELKSSLIDETKRKCEELIRLMKNKSKVDGKKSEYENELFKRSKELALSLKGIELSEAELKENFNFLWKEWLYAVSSDAPYAEEPNIRVDVENILLEYFNQEPNIRKIIKNSSDKNMFSIDFSKHIIIEKTWYRYSKTLDDYDKENIEQVTSHIRNLVKAKIDEKEQQKLDYNQSYFYEILAAIKKEIVSAPSNKKYKFNKVYRTDLSVFLCKMAAERFEDMHMAYKKANNLAVYLENKREDFFKCFQISCQGATSITTFADFLCTKLSAAFRQAVYDKTAKDISEHMRANYPAFNGNRAKLEIHILIYLAEQEDFEKFNQYIHFPKVFFENFIKRCVDEYCLNKNNPCLEGFLNNSLENFHSIVLSSIHDSTKVVKDKCGNVSLWLDEFCSRLQKLLILPRSDLKSIEHQEIKDIEFVKEAMGKAWIPVLETLRQDFAVSNMEPFEKKPHTILTEQLGGCWEQCPLCQALCTSTIPGHCEDHSVSHHRPQGVRGTPWYKTDNLVTDICSSLVASDCSFVLSEDRHIPYKKYREAGDPYNKWSITPELSVQPYWKWFVCRFKPQLENKYSKKFHGKGEIPPEWEKITKEAVLTELKKL